MCVDKHLVTVWTFILSGPMFANLFRQNVLDVKVKVQVLVETRSMIVDLDVRSGFVASVRSMCLLLEISVFARPDIIQV